ncbi:SIR2 family protein [Candidatus Bipolaricaulota bacterium]
MTRLVRRLADEYSTLVVLGILTLLSLLVAGILFGIIRSTGLVRIAPMGIVRGAEFGGPFAGFLVTLVVLIRSYRSIASEGPLRIVGTVMSLDGAPVEGARVVVEGHEGDRITNSAGWFDIVVESRSSYRLSTSLAGREARVDIARKLLGRPISIELPSAGPGGTSPHQAEALPQQIEWRGVAPQALPELLEEAVAGRLVLVVGSEVSELAGPAYEGYRDLVGGTDDDQAVAAVLDRVPPTDAHCSIHRSLVDIARERIYTTNFDGLLETAGGGDVISVATDDELESVPHDVDDALVVKLCGDRAHPEQIRATRPRLTAHGLQRDSIALFGDYAYYLQNRAFLYVGYSPDDDPFLEFLLDIVDYHCPAGRLPRKPHFLLGFDMDTDEQNAFRSQYSNRLIPISVSTVERNREEALVELVQAIQDYRRVPPRYRNGILPAECQRRMRHAPRSDVGALPLVRTQHPLSSTAVRDTIGPVIAKSGKSFREFSVARVSPFPDSSDPFWRMLEEEVCAVFVFGGESPELELLLRNARQHLDFQPVILVHDESLLGMGTAALLHRRLDHGDVDYYILDQITRVPIEARFGRCERYLDSGEYDNCVIHAWIAVEEFAQYARVGINRPSGGPATVDTTINLMRAIAEMRAAANLTYVNEPYLDRIRAIRNAVEHEGVGVSFEQARETLKFCKGLFRSMSFDIRELVGELVTFSADGG